MPISLYFYFSNYRQLSSVEIPFPDHTIFFLNFQIPYWKSSFPVHRQILRRRSHKYKTFKNKSVTKIHQIQKKCIEYKTFKLGYGQTKPFNTKTRGWGRGDQFNPSPIPPLVAFQKMHLLERG